MGVSDGQASEGGPVAIRISRDHGDPPTILGRSCKPSIAMILCGISTNFGVESTARFAYEYGYNQVFAEDAMAALSAEEHTITVTKIFPRIGLVRKTKEILADLSPD